MGIILATWNVAAKPRYFQDAQNCIVWDNPWQAVIARHNPPFTFKDPRACFVAHDISIRLVALCGWWHCCAAGDRRPASRPPELKSEIWDSETPIQRCADIAIATAQGGGSLYDIARQIAAEDILVGQYIAKLHDRNTCRYCEIDGEQWKRRSPWELPWDIEPYEVKAICLPYILVMDADGDVETFDARRHRFALLPGSFGRLPFDIKKEEQHREKEEADRAEPAKDAEWMHDPFSPPSMTGG
jgi:hypothetical protein